MPMNNPVPSSGAAWGSWGNEVHQKLNTAVVESTNVRNIVRLTQAAYNALGTKDPNTLYVVVG